MHAKKRGMNHSIDGKGQAVHSASSQPIFIKKTVTSVQIQLKESFFQISWRFTSAVSLYARSITADKLFFLFIN